jgi:phosphatidylinositol kinase/protein kinase (PI-3  family)
MGVTGVEGPFRRCGEATMEVLRRHADAIAVVVDVFLHDPLYQWVLTEDKKRARQHEGKVRVA